jgi:diaminopimelate epimerase
MTFHKYHGAGNDFLLFDDREGHLLPQLDQPTIAAYCTRRFGVGADGLMLLRKHPDYDFEMVYYNSDGAPSSMCGNGGRCIVRFAADLGILRDEYHFLAVDGPHRAKLLPDGNVSLEMNDVSSVHCPNPEAFVLDTGSPHYISFVDDATAVDVVLDGRAIRQSPTYAAEGINVNFVSGDLSDLRIATYERGVEDETLACGTGVTAAAIAAVKKMNPAPGDFLVPVKAKGGQLSVKGHYDGERFTGLWLEGPAVVVFKGVIG